MDVWALGVDIGGTFTDVVALREADGRMCSIKVLTTHGDPSRGVIAGVRDLFSRDAIDAGSVDKVVHATTLFTNALIERKGCATGLLSNDGFSDILEMGSERKYDLYDANIVKVPALVEHRLRAEVGARLRADGTEFQPVDRDEVLERVEGLVQKGIESLAICLLHAYANPAHEREIAGIVAQAYPRLSLTLSCDVAPVVREYERMTTTVASAYIKPLAAKYLRALQRELRQLGIPVDLLMMLSNGGLTHVEEAIRNPIELLESGPAAGAMAAARFGLRDQEADLLAFDMGGTTAKLSLVERGQPAITHGFEAARQRRFAEGSGLPLHITTTDLIEIGAGGGSIAHTDQLGLLKVGPQSAGSEPGPACYGAGGREATVTDANLALGYLNPDYFAGGTIHISPTLARQALERVSEAVHRPVLGTAWGIHDIVAENMSGAARVHVAERGRDPQNFVLLCTGGGGPLHAYAVARKIGVRKILCPPAAGVASAYGLLVAPARSDRSRTVKIRPATDALSRLEEAFQALERQAAEPLHSLEASFGPIALQRHADGRFAGQGFNLTVRLPDGPYQGDGIEEDAMRGRLLDAFEAAYLEKFGRTPPDIPVELINIRVTAEAPPRKRPRHKPLSARGDIRPKGTRPVYFSEADAMMEIPVYERSALGAGFRQDGPLLIEEEGSTLVVGPKGRVEQSASGNLVITLGD